jgi:chemotaxis protein CheD
MTQENIVKVGMADLNVAKQNGIIKTTGLGSCVGLSLYDAKERIAGLAHIMLPSSSIVRDGVINTAKYADTAVPELLRRMEKLGANRSRLVAKLAGGAQMFAVGSSLDAMRIGLRNVEASKEMLAQFGIPILAEDTGENYGRSIEVLIDNGLMVVKSVNRPTKEL